MSFDPVAYLEEEDPSREDWGDAGAARPPSQGGFDPVAYLSEPEAVPAEAIAPDPDLGIPQPVPEPMPKPPLSTEATLRGAVANTLGGATYNWADEMAGLSAKSRQQQRRPNSPDWSMGDLAALQPRIADLVKAGVPFNEAAQQAAKEFEDGEYKKGRDAFRRVQEDFREENPKAAFGLNVAGGVLTGGAVNATGKGAATYAPTVIEGALAGAGASDESDGMLGGALFGGTLGAAFKYAGGKASDWLGPVFERMAGRGRSGQAEARQLAEAMAARDVNKTVQSLRGEAGGAASRVGNSIKNIEEIELDPNHPSRTVGYVRDMLAKKIAAIEEAADAARQQAFASGIDPDDLGAGRMGEFISSGSKLDAAQKIAKKIATYEATLEQLRGEAQKLAGRAADEIIPTNAPALMAQRAALTADPAFLDVKENVLKNALGSFEDDATEALARRAVYAQALEGRPDAIRQQTERLISGRAARERFGQLLLRYGPPAVGSMVGSAVGGAEGAAVGAVTGAALGGGMSSMVGALGGAGMRPALQAFYRTATTYPAVQNVFWRGVERTANAAPRFGAFAQELAEAAARSPEALADTHARLSAAKGEAGKAYAEFMEGVMEASKSDTAAMNDADLAAYLAEANPEALGTYAAQMAQAAKDGKLSIVHYVLIQRDPNYRAALQSYRERAGQTQSMEPAK